MKKIAKFFMAAMLTLGLAGITSCSKDDKTEDNSGDPHFAFVYMNRTLEPDQTVYYYPTMEQTANDFAVVDFFIENTTSDAVNAVVKVERIDGPEAFDDLTICFGETCKTGTCPWTSDPFVLHAGLNDDLPIHVDYVPSLATTPGVYRITVGESSALAHRQTMILSLSRPID